MKYKKQDNNITLIQTARLSFNDRSDVVHINFNCSLVLFLIGIFKKTLGKGLYWSEHFFVYFSSDFASGSV